MIFMNKRKSAPTPASTADSDYRHLFSCPEVVRDLLKGYVPGKWLNDVDFSTLVHVSGSYVSESRKQRHDDSVWRVNINGRGLWVYIITEFQSQPDHWMALRIMEYVNQLSLQLTRELKKQKLPENRIPPILPIVIYNGLTEWNAATDAADCYIEPPGGLEAFQPRLRYLLLDTHRLKLSRTKEIRTFADAVFRMEANKGKTDLFAVIKALAETLNAPELESLRRAFNVWVKGLLKRHEPNLKIVEKIRGINDIFGEYAMAEAAYEIWSDTARNEGRKEGEATLLVRLLTHRFGPLPKWAETRVNKANPAQLEKWATAVFDASKLTEVLGAPGRQ
jgi:hypothetical protein